MIKEKDILIRISSELKEKVKAAAKATGVSTSAFIRMLIIKEVGNG